MFGPILESSRPPSACIGSLIGGTGEGVLSLLSSRKGVGSSGALPPNLVAPCGVAPS
jgi:hypothetical protein